MMNLIIDDNKHKATMRSLRSKRSNNGDGSNGGSVTNFNSNFNSIDHNTGTHTHINIFRSGIEDTFANTH